MNFNKEALFHDGTADFCKVEKKGAQYIYSLILRTGAGSTKSAYIGIDGKEYEMTCISEGMLFDMYEYKLELTDEIVRYHFRVVTEEEVLFYDMSGAYDNLSGNYEFELTAGFETPDWAKGAVMYQIFTDRFCKEIKATM